MSVILGEITINQISYFEVDTNPSIGAGLPAPLGSQAVAMDTGNVWVKKGALNTNWSQVSLIGSLSGNGIYAQSLGVTATTSSAVFTTKLVFVTPVLELGNYKLDLSTKMNSSNSNRGIVVQLLDGATVIQEAIYYLANSVNTNPQFSFFTILENISGSKTFTVKFKLGTGGSSSVSLSQTVLVLTKVA